MYDIFFKKGNNEWWIIYNPNNIVGKYKISNYNIRIFMLVHVETWFKTCSKIINCDSWFQKDFGSMLSSFNLWVTIL